MIRNLIIIIASLIFISSTTFAKDLKIYCIEEGSFFKFGPYHDVKKCSDIDSKLLEITEKFYNKLKSIDLTNVSSIKINKSFSMNIGIYSQNIINKFKYFLLTVKNTDDNKCMDFKLGKWEDYIFNNDVNNTILDNYDGWNYTGPTDYYNTGTMRIVEYYPNLDLYKIKANWGQGTWTLNN